MGVGIGRAKLIVLGEHAAVYGAPAVGVTLPWTLRAQWKPARDWQLPGLGPQEPAVRNLIEGLTSMALEAGLPPPPTGTIDFETQIPLSSGFGSSGALCAALVNLFWPHLPLTEKDHWAWRAEGQFHGTPSGIDTALALREGWWALDTKTRPVTARPLPTPAVHLVVGGLHRQGTTLGLVGSLSQRLAAGDLKARALVDHLGDLAHSGIEALAGRASPPFPELVNQARGALQALGLETPEMSTVIDRALADGGAVAGKLSGAGGGGAFFLVYPDRATAQRNLPWLERQVPETSWTHKPSLL